MVIHEASVRMKCDSHILNIVLAHGLNQIDGPHNIVGVVQHRVLHALTHGLASRKMDHRVESAARSREVIVV